MTVCIKQLNLIVADQGVSAIVLDCAAVFRVDYTGAMVRSLAVVMDAMLAFRLTVIGAGEVCAGSEGERRECACRLPRAGRREGARRVVVMHWLYHP